MARKETARKFVVLQRSTRLLATEFPGGFALGLAYQGCSLNRFWRTVA